MNRLFSITLIAIIILSSCSSYKKEIAYVHNSPIYPKIHKLQPTTVDAHGIFEKELYKNILDTSSELIYGTIEMNLVKDNSGTGGIGWLILNIFTACIPYYLGCPMWEETSSLEYDFIIYDIKGNVVANYTINGYKKQRVGLYYGDPITLQVRTIKEIVYELNNKLHLDAEKINHKLETAILTATEEDFQRILKQIIELRKNNINTREHSNTYNQINSFQQNANNQLLNQQQQINQGRSRQQIMVDINKWEGYKKDYERYLSEENKKSGSNYSPMRANMWNMKIAEVNKKLQELQNELRKATH
ncbi:MAG: hypothetical protein IKB11_07885 [Bacteroidaceae bacterium]|nr:hypothetical protein [Bacteroidaceae bacterium]